MFEEQKPETLFQMTEFDLLDQNFLSDELELYRYITYILNNAKESNACTVKEQRKVNG